MRLFYMIGHCVIASYLCDIGLLVSQKYCRLTIISFNTFLDGFARIADVATRSKGMRAHTHVYCCKYTHRCTQLDCMNSYIVLCKEMTWNVFVSFLKMYKNLNLPMLV